MGRNSKFSFPVPGRRRSSTKSSRSDVVSTSDTDRTPSLGPRLSKAQRLLGAENSLNIDAPPRHNDDGRSYRSVAPNASVISVAVSESTRDEEGYNSGWDGESAVLPRYELRGKPSSTVLGHRSQEASATDDTNVETRLHTARSNTTLRSHYDRTKSPLSISQQTSASSTRDLALRKGFLPVTSGFPRSPLLDVNLVQEKEQSCSQQESTNFELPVAPQPKKKPTRLDLSRLFSKSRKDAPIALNLANFDAKPTSNSLKNPASIRNDEHRPRKLVKAPSRESLPTKGLRSESQTHLSRPPPPQVRGSNHDTLHDLYEEYENLPYQTSVTRPVQTPRIVNHKTSNEMQEQMNPESKKSKHRDFQWNPYPEDNIANRSVASPPAPIWDRQSTTSSNRTAGSKFSDSDLRMNSVLSLSSDEDEDDQNRQDVTTPAPHEFHQRDHISYLDSQRPTDSSKRTSKPVPTRIVQDGKFLTIPEKIPIKQRPSEPESRLQRDLKHQDPIKPVFHRPRLPKVASESQHSSPPPSPSSVKSQATGQSSRVMVVSKQEEALLEALRQKRARMREKIIKEHEKTNKTASPPAQTRLDAMYRHSIKQEGRNSPEKHQDHRNTRESKMTIRIFRESDIRVQKEQAVESPVEQILPHLPRRTDQIHQIDPAEPSPDLSDFLSFGSDEDDDQTPRTSWIVSKDHSVDKLDPLIEAAYSDRDLPQTPRSAARLSAVGMLHDFPMPARGKGRISQMGFIDHDTGETDEIYHNDHDQNWGIQ